MTQTNRCLEMQGNTTPPQQKGKATQQMYICQCTCTTQMLYTVGNNLTQTPTHLLNALSFQPCSLTPSGSGCMRK